MVATTIAAPHFPPSSPPGLLSTRAHAALALLGLLFFMAWTTWTVPVDELPSAWATFPFSDF